MTSKAAHLLIETGNTTRHSHTSCHGDASCHGEANFEAGVAFGHAPRQMRY